MHNYYPCLISKLGELNALKCLDHPNKKVSSPILDIVREGIDLDIIAKSLKKHWCFPGNQLLLDYSRYQDDADLKLIDGLIRALRVGDVNVIPTVTLSPSVGQKKLAKAHIKKKKSGIAIRIPFKNGTIIDLPLLIKNLIEDFGVNESETILILDFGFVQPEGVESVVASVRATMDMLDGKKYKAAVVLSGCFPKDLSNFEISKLPQAIKRVEEGIYWKVVKSFKFILYGDYGTKHPDYVPSNKHAGTCSVKYSTKNSFIIYRGKLAKNSKFGNGQYIRHCRELIKSRDYSGEHFCWGDEKIKTIAKEKLTNDRAKTGNATTWVTISISHHITLINSLPSS